MPPLYMRREPTTDARTAAAEEFAPQRRFDVVAYKDQAATKAAGRWPWYYTSKPDKRRRWQMLNCFLYRAVWLPDLEASAAPAPKKPRRPPSPILKAPEL